MIWHALLWASGVAFLLRGAWLFSLWVTDRLIIPAIERRPRR